MFLLLFAACALQLLLLRVDARVFTEILPQTDECFSEQVVPGSTGLKGTFEVIEGGQLDIDVTVTMGGEVVHSLQYARRGDFDVKHGPGLYTVCFSNAMSSVTHKIVGFSLHGGLGDLLEDEDVAKDVEHVLPIKGTIDRLAFQIQKLQEHERYLGERMHRHIKTAESTSSRVFLSTLAEALVLLLANLAQVWYMKRYFETRRKL